MRAISVGDNAMDCYMEQGMRYPGGNSVNVAVGMKRAGCEDVAYLGVFGNDPEAEEIMRVLSEEGITYDQCRRVYAPTNQPRVKLIGDDRVFVGGLSNSAQHVVRLRLMPEDLAYLKTFDICHASFFASIEQELPSIQKACRLSFDFSSMQRKDYLEKVCPYIRIAFFSGSHMKEEQILTLIETVRTLGPEIIVITLGNRGALLFQNGARYDQDLIPTDAIDTLGAGDSFIAGFLTSFGKGDSIPEALRFAAQCGAETCRHFGALGYGKPFDRG